VRIGVLGLQGAFREHIYALEALDVTAIPIRLPDQLEDLAGLIIPGGESTAIAKLMESYGFYEPIAEKCAAGMAVWGTCAGAILVATDVVDAIESQRPLGLIDMTVRRNAYGRQSDSFEADLDIEGLEEPFPGVFIRAPWIEQVRGGVRVICEHDGHAVAAVSGAVLTTTFHPELTGDPRMHRYFLEKVVGSSVG
jgi:5'-phosphate synthase pdxT subunit